MSDSEKNSTIGKDFQKKDPTIEDLYLHRFLIFFTRFVFNLFIKL
jgi:hypothetical protein